MRAAKSLAQRRKLAEAVRQACLEAMRQAYEEAQVQGLCAEGAFEAALSAVAMLDLQPLIEQDP